MDFTITEEERLVQLTVRRFVQEDLIPLEREFLMVDQSFVISRNLLRD